MTLILDPIFRSVLVPLLLVLLSLRGKGFGAHVELC